MFWDGFFYFSYANSIGGVPTVINLGVLFSWLVSSVTQLGSAYFGFTVFGSIAAGMLLFRCLKRLLGKVINKSL